VRLVASEGDKTKDASNRRYYCLEEVLVGHGGGGLKDMDGGI
jgi:hypothetical protein